MSIQTDIANIAISQIGNGASKFRSWYYGSNLSGVAWCAVFVSWCANQLGQLNKCIVKTDGAGCFAREGVPKGFGDWLEAKRYIEPKTGDIITFRNWGNSVYSDKYHADHVGLIVGVSKASDNTYNITTVEGNTNGTNDTSSVNKRTYNSTNGYVYAYYRPKYDTRTESEDDYMVVKNGDTNNFALSVKRQLQQLKALGMITASVDNSAGYGNGSVQAIKEVQAKAGIRVDGECGEDTIKAMDKMIKTAIAKLQKPTAVTKSTTVAELAKMAGV